MANWTSEGKEWEVNKSVWRNIDKKFPKFDENYKLRYQSSSINLKLNKYNETHLKVYNDLMKTRDTEKIFMQPEIKDTLHTEEQRRIKILTKTKLRDNLEIS